MSTIVDSIFPDPLLFATMLPHFVRSKGQKYDIVQSRADLLQAAQASRDEAAAARAAGQAHHDRTGKIDPYFAIHAAVETKLATAYQQLADALGPLEDRLRDVPSEST